MSYTPIPLPFSIGLLLMTQISQARLYHHLPLRYTIPVLSHNQSVEVSTRCRPPFQYMRYPPPS